MTGEEGAGVAVWSHTQYQEVEDGHFALVGKNLPQLCNVVLCGGAHVYGGIDRVDVAGRDTHVVEELSLDVGDVGVRVGELDVTFVAREDVPLAPLDVGAGPEPRAHDLGCAAAGETDRELPTTCSGFLGSTSNYVTHLLSQLVLASRHDMHCSIVHL